MVSCNLIATMRKYLAKMAKNVGNPLGNGFLQQLERVSNYST